MVSRKKTKQHYTNINGNHFKLDINNSGTTLDVSVRLKNNTDVVAQSIVLITTTLLNLIAIFYFTTFLVNSVVFLFSLIWMLLLIRSVKQERLVAVKDLGIQINTTFIIGSKTVFIPYEQVQTVFINEVIYREKAIYLLTLVTKNISSKSTLVPLFPNIMPRINCLQEVYNNLKFVLPKEDSKEINKTLRITILNQSEK